MSASPTADPPPPFSTAWALFLDVDGTLIEHADHPQNVRVDAQLLALLRDLLREGGGAVALISGRAVADLDRLFAPLQFPAAGQHGTERRGADGSMHRHRPPSDRLEAAAQALARLSAAHSGLVIENKGISLALHYRLAPALEGLAQREMSAAAAALGDGFELQAGKFVFEIKPGGKDKGSAIAEFMAEPPFAGRTPVFLGDDLTDEYGFTLVNANQGHSVKVGPGGSSARWRLPGTAQVRDWLAAALRADGRLVGGEAR
jgi:trehalose 6-phosphate phosphatase